MQIEVKFGVTACIWIGLQAVHADRFLEKNIGVFVISRFLDRNGNIRREVPLVPGTALHPLILAFVARLASVKIGRLVHIDPNSIEFETFRRAREARTESDDLIGPPFLRRRAEEVGEGSCRVVVLQLVDPVLFV